MPSVHEPLRQHERVLADGMFRVVLTGQHRVFAVVDARETLLGPVRFRFEVDRGLTPALVRRHAIELARVPPEIAVAGIFSDVSRAVSRAGISTFQTVARTANSVARPLVQVTQSAATQGARLLSAKRPARSLRRRVARWKRRRAW